MRVKRAFLALTLLLVALLSYAGVSQLALVSVSANEIKAASGPGLDPVEGATFLVSAEFSLSEVLKQDAKQLILSKYNSNGGKHTGWAIALATFNTSTRIEVYWRSGGGGGWFTLGEVELKPNTKYSISLAAKPDSFLVAFLSEAGKVKNFLGGADLTNTGLPRSEAPLVLGTAKSNRFQLRGDISQVVIASSATFSEGKAELEGLFIDGPRTLLAGVQAEDIRLTLGGQ